MTTLRRKGRTEDVSHQAKDNKKFIDWRKINSVWMSLVNNFIESNGNYHLLNRQIFIYELSMLYNNWQKMKKTFQSDWETRMSLFWLGFENRKRKRMENVKRNKQTHLSGSAVGWSAIRKHSRRGRDVPFLPPSCWTGFIHFSCIWKAKQKVNLISSHLWTKTLNGILMNNDAELPLQIYFELSFLVHWKQ